MTGVKRIRTGYRPFRVAEFRPENLDEDQSAKVVYAAET